MGKEKRPHQEKSENEDNEKQSNLNPTKMVGSDQPDDVDSVEKLSSLKSLTALLSKETVEKRQEVACLLESKKSLENELTRSVSQVEASKAELNRMEEVEIDVKVRKVVVATFVQSQMTSEVERLRGELMKGKAESEAEIGVLKKAGMKLRGEIEKVVLENGYLKKEIEGRNEEARRMKEMFVEFEARERGSKDEGDELRERYEVAVSDLSDSKSKVEEMKVELGVLGKNCDKLKGEIEGLKGEKEVVLREKDELLKERSEYEAKVSELEKEVSGLNAIVWSLREDEEKWRVKFFELEKINDEMRQRIGELRNELDGLMEEKKAKEREIESLVDEKSSLSARISELEKTNDEMSGRIGELGNELDGLMEEKKVKESEIESLVDEKSSLGVRISELEKINDEMSARIGELGNKLDGLMEEKKVEESEIASLVDEKSSLSIRISELEKDLMEIKQVKDETLEENDRLEQVKTKLEDKIVDLQNMVNELMGSLSSLQELNSECIEKNKRLVAEIEGYKTSEAQVMSERDDVKRTLEEEKMNGMKLQEKVSEVSKKMEETAKVIEELRAVSDTLVKEKKELENKYTNLVNEKALSDKNHEDSKMKITELERIMRSKADAFDSVLEMLKDTAGQVMRNTNGNEDGNGEEMEPYMAEVERIRLALKSRDDKVGEMEEQLESLKWSVIEAKKKKSLWRLASSCATLFAAIASYAFVAKVR